MDKEIEHSAKIVFEYWTEIDRSVGYYMIEYNIVQNENNIKNADDIVDAYITENMTVEEVEEEERAAYNEKTKQVGKLLKILLI